MADTAVKIPFAEAAAPSTPAANKVVIYAKSDGLMYSKDDAGVETLMSAGAGSGIPETILDAKGDIIAASAADTAARLAVGSNGTILTAASGQSTGLEWAAAPTAGRATRSAGDLTTTSTSFVDVTGASITITTRARRVFLAFNTAYTNSGANHGGFDFDIDGTRAASGSTYGLQLARAISSGEYTAISIQWLTDVLSAGSHTFKVQWKVGGGTGTIAASTSLSAYSFTAFEVGAIA